MSFSIKLFNKKRCKFCKKKYDDKEQETELRVSTSSGIVTMIVCRDCGDFWDQSSTIMERMRHRK
jgi:hypothetical protein